MADKAPSNREFNSPNAQAEGLQTENERDRHQLATTKTDIESQATSGESPEAKKQSAFKSLGWLDRYLALWILLAIVLGILLGNFAPHTAEALDRGRFVGVSVPIGAFYVPFPSHHLSWSLVSFIPLPPRPLNE